MIKSPETAGRVSGMVTCSRDIPLPADAVLHVILSDVTLPGKPHAIAAQDITLPSSKPIEFIIKYDESIIDPEHAYAIQACIRYNQKISSQLCFGVKNEENEPHRCNAPKARRHRKLLTKREFYKKIKALNLPI